VEILKALYRRAKILILDEPTAVLTPQERDGLFEMLRALKDDGRAVVLVTHKLNEVMSISDRLTVLRGGRSIVSRRTCDTNPAELARDMTGRDVDLDRRFASGACGDVVLTVENLSVVDGGMTAVKGVSLEVRSGEIVAIAGVAGNGQSELLRALTGLSHVSAGRVQLGDTDITHADVDRRRRSGLAYVPEDRHETGTAPEASISDNLVMGRHRLRDLVTRWRTHRTVRMETLASSLAEEFAIKTASVRLPAQTLSGGNLQKVVLARELSATSRALIVEQPTRGVDIGAIEYIHQLLDKRRKAGLAILLVSSELSEIFALADRILVMFEGAIIGELARDQADEQSVGLLMAGVA
jgi:simple sugar transport system ATP-binding protein